MATRSSRLFYESCAYVGVALSAQVIFEHLKRVIQGSDPTSPLSLRHGFITRPGPWLLVAFYFVFFLTCFRFRLLFSCVCLRLRYPPSARPPTRPPARTTLDAVVSRVRPLQADSRVRRPHGRPLFRVLQGVPRGM